MCTFVYREDKALKKCVTDENWKFIVGVNAKLWNECNFDGLQNGGSHQHGLMMGFKVSLMALFKVLQNIPSRLHTAS